MEFRQLNRGDMGALAPYFAAQNTHIGDYSLGFLFMWGEALHIDYGFWSGCLVLHEFYAGCNYFYYPLSLTGDGREEEAAISEIERACREENRRLHFTSIPEGKLPVLLRRYAECGVNNRRRWRDYLYNASDFQTYPGKRYAGQRNHVHKFEKLYPDWSFLPYSPEDLPELTEFLREYADRQRSKDLFLAKEEMDETLELVPKLEELGLFAGILRAGGRIVGFSAGERCGDMVIVHIEKAFREYEGAYPALARQFARTFCGEGVRYLNRMDDAGDPGLRKSKLQYLPCELVGKYNVLPKRAIDLLSKEPELRTERLTIGPLTDGDEAEYTRLASDVERNRYWGYDWRTDCTAPPKGYFLELAREDFRRKDELPLGIYAAGRLVGEVVLHRFGYRAEVELGVRLFKEAEGKGYAAEAMRAMADYALFRLNLELVEAKCYRENVRSERMLRAAGFFPCGEDDTFFYFKRTAGT